MQVRLPDKSRIGRGAVNVWFSGTVRAVDEPGLPRGVRIDLDETVNGGCDCYATHAELRAAQ